MSNVLAIAAATATLRNLLLSQIPLLDTDLSDLEVTTQPLDLARKGITKAQLNLFLYQTAVNAAWRNLDMPRQVRPGENGAPPLATNLHYLITAYGRGESDNDAVSHRVLGGAMSVLHDNAMLDRGAIRLALPNNDLGEQFERVKITPLDIGVEELSKLWTMAQTQYRVSAAYEVTVILIDSQAAVRAPLPVLNRGPQDRGVDTMTGSAPYLSALRPPRSQAAARLGEDVLITGRHLTVADTLLRFASTRLAQRIELAPTDGDARQIRVHLPDQADDAQAWARWAPGFYSLGLVLQRPGLPAIASNELALALAPRITVAPNNAAPGTVNLTVSCAPRIVEGQRVLLLFGDRQVEPASITTPGDISQPSTLTFSIPGVTADVYLVRLRVDGVDSIPVVYSGDPPVAGFDPSQKVTVA